MKAREITTKAGGNGLVQIELRFASGWGKGYFYPPWADGKAGSPAALNATKGYGGYNYGMMMHPMLGLR